MPEVVLGLSLLLLFVALQAAVGWPAGRGATTVTIAHVTFCLAFVTVIVQAKLAIGSGGVSGTGLGNGLQKVFYLPEAHTDMIMATVGEELGLIGFLGVIALLGAVVWSGYRIALSAPDQRQRLLAGGLTSLIGIQAIVNLGAVLGMLPVTGVPLPFMSYGGSSLVVFAAASGILVGIGRRSHARRSRNLTVVRSGDEPAHRDRGGRDSRAHHAGARAR